MGNSIDLTLLNHPRVPSFAVITFFRSRDNFTFLRRNIKWRDITSFVIFGHYVKFQSDMMKSFEVMASGSKKTLNASIGLNIKDVNLFDPM